jgi:hypothetical protein
MEAHIAIENIARAFFIAAISKSFFSLDDRSLRVI